MVKKENMSDRTGSGEEARNRRGFLRAAAAGAVGAAATAVLPSGAWAQQLAQGTVVVVEMNNALRFVPDQVMVKVGDTVEWRNIQTFPHTVTADPDKAANPGNVELPDGAEPFDSGVLRAGQTFRRTFTKPGRYRYVCLPHEGAGMLGSVIVG